MATILGFAGSNSSTSINYKLVQYTAKLTLNHDVRLLNLANFPFPMYSEDYEKENGYSNALVEVKDDIRSADALIISVSEHNGHPSAYFKNFLDWLSRVDKNFLEGKKILLMATSPGKRGAISALDLVNQLLPRFGATAITTFSLPSFYENFEDSKGITDVDLAKKHQEALTNFSAEI